MMEARHEIPPVMAQSPANAADAARQGVTGGMAPSIPRRRFARRRVVWAALVVRTLGAATFGVANFNRPENCYRRALQALGRDDFDRAQYELLRLQGLPEYEPHASLINGILLLQKQNLEGALEEFRQAAEHVDTRALALTLAGKTLLRQRQFARAEAVLQQALEYDPNLAEVHGSLGAAYFDVGDVRLALEHLDKAAKLSPNDPRPYQLMATIHQSFRQDKTAIEDLRELLRRGATGSVRQEALLDMAQLQSRLKRHQEAIDTLQGADESPDSLALLADCQFALGNLEGARDCVDRALGLDPGQFEARLMQGRLAMEAKDFTAAIESLNRAFEVRPKSQVVNTLLSQALHALGKDDLAAQHAETAEQLRELNRQYAELSESFGREPRNALTCYRLGLMAERLGLQSQATAWYRAAVLLDPRYTKAGERLSQLPGGTDVRP